ncbi:MAG TPA: MotA/TolQ/ExbB proton channel family protein [Zoogloea sp.]|uniref:MotA/TolQ/ExbB proton channel family protein n=1 Tax=Zoogloea sp. TaxID=49181 RepID=UPI002CF505FD|nr:MotA/TolQ/ExbB proton channel family protein [Zoogloea sp.]HMV18811.1 MotA/TolQ/ExbB proton channel family protein [Rhodocyclaceae bacterium]HMV63526.1 MotA/TolQ/ExbB proton channel family protein [Rhodocyclaceae bacterium]HMW51772.1 MotA/TolQ/ExbB proton channel family protein [Rhodocyclaceae bacterium]HMY51148.1 MotA/TolQ/ExbB proton channel family protein [Rhodocyclaceae bacterium]HMZ76811.1 MotA/TolQ/ExbB proton channel family protein [Rhodocyclaceae bacterium]
MNAALESLLYEASQLFLVPVLLAIAGLFLYAFYAVGAFLWQARQRHAGDPAGFELMGLLAAQPDLGVADLEAHAFRRLEVARIATRVAPMLGLVATMIPLGPALRALGDGHMADVSRGLGVAFSAVILALVAASLTFWVVNVRRRWYASDLLAIEARLSGSGR